MAMTSNVVDVQLDAAALRALGAYLDSPDVEGELRRDPLGVLAAYVPRVPDHIARAVWGRAQASPNCSAAAVPIPSPSARAHLPLISARRRAFWDKVHARDPHAGGTAAEPLSAVEEEVSLRLLRQRAPAQFQRAVGSLSLPAIPGGDEGLPPPRSTVAEGQTEGEGLHAVKGAAFARLLQQVDQEDAALAYGAAASGAGGEKTASFLPLQGDGLDGQLPPPRKPSAPKPEEEEFVPEEESDDEEQPARPVASASPRRASDESLGLHLFAQQMRARFLAGDQTIFPYSLYTHVDFDSSLDPQLPRATSPRPAGDLRGVTDEDRWFDGSDSD